MKKNRRKDWDEYNAHADSVTLPAWMDYPTEDPKVYRILEVNGGYKIEGKSATFDEISTAYDYVREELMGTPDLNEISDGMMFTENNRILISHTPDDRNRLDRHEYWSFLQQNEAYQADPEDFHTAYHWLRTHPAFYRRHENRMNDWIQDDGLEQMGMSVMRDDQSGETKILLEHGAMSDDKRANGTRYADFRLDSWGPTYESAIITLASKVNKHFDLEGVDRGIEEEPPGWLKKVIERMKDSDPADDLHE